MSPTFPFDTPHTDNPAPAHRGGSIDRWEDEGGPPMPPIRSRKRASSTRALPLIDHDKRETATICRERAAADLLESATLATVNERRRMEASAASWTARANLLGRIESGIEARRQAAADLAGDPSAHLRT
jgi:hypothetical protein